MSIIVLKQIEKSFLNGKNRLQVLKQLNFQAERQDYISIVGKSGTGKTTLLNIISLLDVHFSETYHFDGEEIRNLSPKALYRKRVANIGYVFQNHNLISELSVLENVEMPLGFLGHNKTERRRIAMECLEIVGLSTKATSMPNHLSGGEQQRVSIARAISISPKMLIADEPTGSLDPVTSLQIMETIERVNSLGTTVILVTHDEDVAARSKRCYILSDGVLRLKNS